MSQRRRPASQFSSGPEETIDTNKSSLDDLAKKCVRFLLTKMHTNVPIKRADIVQHVFQEKPGKSFDIVLENASKYLNQIYGLNIEIVDTDTTLKKYFISNNLPYSHLIPNDHESDLKSTIIFLILTHIFMSKNNSTDISLWKFLQEFDITPKTECEIIGNIKIFVTQTLVKQNYILIEDRGGEHDDGEPKKRYKWGPRAEEIVSKKKMLKFVSKLYDDQDPEFWSEQFKDANEQFAGCENR